MQKLINVIALLSGLTSLGLISGSAYVLLNKDAMIENVKEEISTQVSDVVTKSVTKTVTKTVKDSLPGMISGAMPKMPEVPKFPTKTGGAFPF